MRSMTMRGLVVSASMLAGSAHAAATFNTTLSCGQTLALNTTASGLSISCLGGLSLSGGSVVADEALSFSSDTGITLIDVLVHGTALSFTAPFIDAQGTTALVADSTINIASNIPGPAPMPITGGDVQLTSGAVVSIGQSPNPSAGLSVHTSATTPTFVSLQPGGTVVLQNTGGVQFTIDGQLSPSLWAGNSLPTLQVQAIPEPATWALMAAGLTMLLVARRQRR